MQNIEGKPNISYPTVWEYKIFSTDFDSLHKIVFDMMDKEYELTHSKTSNKGKYHSFKLTLEVDSEEHRNKIFKELNKLQMVAFVL